MIQYFKTTQEDKTLIDEIFCDNYKIIETDIIYLFKPDSEICLHFMFKGLSFNVRIFHKSIKEENQEVKTESNGDEVKITFINYDSSSGIGTSMPLEIATTGGKKIYMHLWSYLSAKTVRKLEYTVFCER